MRYALKISDPATDRQCEVYVETDKDLEVLLLFLKRCPGLEHEVRELKDEPRDC
ncbi:MAG: hypothetical protein JRH07_11745 [Deltaproteobacteria bacterium]|nr:hypothetical protein [Deltaproteobacteria bacterium]MBW2122505.1 hypothetical protein [Deltaproteobacteria bacterium]